MIRNLRGRETDEGAAPACNSSHLSPSLRNCVGAILACIVLAGLLAGCATSVNSLTKAELSTIRIESVDVRFKPDAHIWWGAAEREYADKGGAVPVSAAATSVGPASESDGEGTDAYRERVNSPEAKAYVRDKLASTIESRLRQAVLPKFQGVRAVRLEVEVHSFIIPSAAQRLVFGGAPALATVTTLRDVATGAELAKLDRVNAAMAGGGILGVAVDQAFSDLEDRVMDTYMQNVLNWLTVT